MQFHVVVNPAGASGRAWKLWEKLEPMFQLSEHEYILYRSTRQKGITEICQEVTSQGKEVRLIIIGGDGTVNEAVNGIADFEHTLFGFVPCGSGNDLALDLGLPKDKKEIVKQLLQGDVKRIQDVGEVVYFDHEDKPHKRRFNISCGFGFDAEICAFVERSKLKKILNRIHLGKLIYLIQGIHVIFTTQLTPLELTYNGKTDSFLKCLFVAGMNHCYEGGGFKFCPHAKADDQQLDLCIADGLKRFDFFRIFPYAYTGKHLQFKGVKEDRCKQIEIKAKRPLWLHTDGEVIGEYTKIEMHILPKCLKLMI